MSDPHDPSPSPPPPVRGGPFRWLLLYTRGLILNQHLRRQTMFYAVIAAMIMFFGGDFFVSDWKEHLLRFVVYWLVCGWLTVLSALLAVYDLILIRVQARRLQRQLRERILGREPEDEG